MRSYILMVSLTLYFISALALADSIPVANHSFEYPLIDLNDNPFYAIPVIAQWREIDLDTDQSSFTGTFKNTTADANDHIWNPDGDQLALLWNQPGNALEQEVASTYQVGKSYQLTLGICLSTSYTPLQGSSLKLVFYYMYGTEFRDIAMGSIPVESVVTRTLRDFSFKLPTVEESDPWADKTIGIAIRPFGPGFGYWDLDNVRLFELPLSPDLTGDGFVNLKDLSEVASDWLSCSQVTADLTGEGCVDDGDLLILLEYWLDNV
jgi:hypothetical protein